MPGGKLTGDLGTNVDETSAESFPASDPPARTPVLGTHLAIADNLSMPAPTPYAQYVGDRDPVAVLKESFDRYRAVRAKISDARWAQPWAPGKWTLRQLIVHVTQWEMIFGVRVRLGVGVPNYVIQPLDQDPLMHEADAVDAATAFDCFEALRAMNIKLLAALTPAQRKLPVTHPERGQIDVNDLMTTLAGHSVHHLMQLEQSVGQ